jgi:hypothetical protein
MGGVSTLHVQLGLSSRRGSVLAGGAVVHFVVGFLVVVVCGRGPLPLSVSLHVSLCSAAAWSPERERGRGSYDGTTTARWAAG